MNTMFPFGLTPPTILYLTLYLLTLALHAFFMSYVLAGSMWLAWATLFPGKATTERAGQPMAACLRDWMPFVLSAAITAAVAPLLFVQILYRQQFYTANLLLGWRWMVVVPVLIIAFYLLYVLKSKSIARWSAVARIGLGLATAGCFIFVAFCWTANHLLSIDAQRWPDVYQTGNVVASIPLLLSRLAMWISGTFTVMPVLLGWQLLAQKCETSADTEVREQETKRLAKIYCGGMVAAFAFAACYAAQIDSTVGAAILSICGWPWIGLGMLGVLMQLAGWWLLAGRGNFTKGLMLSNTLGSTLVLLAAAALREVIRLTHVNIAQMQRHTQEASEISGLILFLIFTVVNVALMAFCVKITLARNKGQTDQ